MKALDHMHEGILFSDFLIRRCICILVITVTVSLPVCTQDQVTVLRATKFIQGGDYGE